MHAHHVISTTLEAGRVHSIKLRVTFFSYADSRIVDCQPMATSLHFPSSWPDETLLAGFPGTRRASSGTETSANWDAGMAGSAWPWPSAGAQERCGAQSSLSSILLLDQSSRVRVAVVRRGCIPINVSRLFSSLLSHCCFCFKPTAV